jgi:2-oxoglutarate dehydrogenase E2 component (dihydrolipoamide succinyltransferase)
VIRNADKLVLAEMEKRIADLGDRARNKKIALSDLQGGTFSITNGGIFGSLMSTPIPNHPQPAILGLHAIKDRPVAIDGQVVIRPMMYVALTYDHRLIDGREAVGFLSLIKESIEDPIRLFLGC